jgi:23S rRNA (uridine2552-2'-O)-methyltransferase
VVDLGAAPGGWMQAVRELVGQNGFVLGVDLNPIKHFKWENVNSLLVDVRGVKPSIILEKLPRKADVVISDLSPNISGIWEVDHARQIDLAENALRLARGILRPKGNFFVKTFQGDLLKSFTEKVNRDFKRLRLVKPKASRKDSAEIYVLAISFRGINTQSKQ